MPVACEIAVAPEPCAIARRLADEGCVALLHSSEPTAALGRWSFVGGPVDRESSRLDPLADDDGEGFGGRGVSALSPRWIGVLPYECARGIERSAWIPRELRPEPALVSPRWRRHRSVVAIDHASGRVFAVGMTRADAEQLAARLRVPAPPEVAAPRVVVRDAEPPERHVERVIAAKELILAGDLYQVNLARRILVSLAARPSPAALLALHAKLLRAAPTPFGACLAFPGGVAVLSSTPELFLAASAEGSVDSGVISAPFTGLSTLPIKGTRARGTDAASDAALARALDEDPKEIAELTMIIDVERHDLGRVAEVGSVRLLGPPRVTTHRTVHHREASLAARARRGLSREAVLSAMLPSGSVTGAPKVRAMEVIASLEPCRRGLYTGALGHVAHDGSLTLAMAIRTLVLEGLEGEYLSGGGIVADSEPVRELEETRWKALQLARLADG